jgi:monothiol glutaredoxin
MENPEIRGSNRVQKEYVELLINSHEVLLLMEGTPEEPCGSFSLRVVSVLERLGIDYQAINALALLDPLREVTAEIAGCATFPQLYVRGELVGDSDVVEEIYLSGELAELLGVGAARALANGERGPRSRGPKSGRLLCERDRASHLRQSCTRTH